MLIHENTLYQLLNSVPDVPPETGGILGGTENVISCFWLDEGNQYDIYVPNVRKINEIISGWQKAGIEFYGIFHSHSKSNKFLSVADKRYIVRIMRSMPPQVTHLYFPLVFPKIRVVPYCAEIKNQSVTIVQETIEIVRRNQS